MKKLFLSDFDGTLVNKDILDVICGINGMEDESRKLNEEFIAGQREGLPTLKKRIDFLNGITQMQIKQKLDENNFLMPGAQELFKYLKQNNYVTVLHSGNIEPVLNYYKNLLNIDYIVGNKPRMNGDAIEGIEIADFASRDFKVVGCKKIIEEVGIVKDDIFAIGDSPADIGVFSLAGTTIVINPKGGVEQYANIVLEHGDLSELITFLKK